MIQTDPKDLPGSPRARPSFKEPIRVEIDDEDFAERGKQHPIWRGYNIAKLLIDAGIPIWLGGGVASFKSVEHGRLAMWCEKRDGRLWRVYEWTPDAMTTGALAVPAPKSIRNFVDGPNINPDPTFPKPPPPPRSPPVARKPAPAVVPFDEDEDEL